MVHRAEQSPDRAAIAVYFSSKCKRLPAPKRILLSNIAIGYVLSVISGCVAYGEIDNHRLASDADLPGYSIERAISTPATSDTTVLLSFSGGGTRAAALAYGVLKALRDSIVPTPYGNTRRLLDDVRSISAVSGGSFTAAYYGLHGDEMFNKFEEEFLRRDLSGAFWRGVFNPVNWFSNRGRTDRAVDYFDNKVFHGAVFDDLNRPGSPLIILNATDLGSGIRFSFLQEYFNLLCSDLSNFKIAKAVTASSAVPIMFHPIVLERYADCAQSKKQSLVAADVDLNTSGAADAELDLTLDKMKQFAKPNVGQSFVHLVDGGITDNLGLRALYETVAASGGVRDFLANFDRTPPRRLVLISINAAIEEPKTLNMTNRRPTVNETALAMSSIQLERYNAATLHLINDNLKRWTKELSTPQNPVDSYFIQIDFDKIADKELQQDLNRIATSYSLSDKQVDSLITTGENILTSSTQYQQLIRDMHGQH